MKKVITRIKGGIGNQLFCFAAARRLAYVNNAELVIDNISGFSYDYQYKRKYQLSHFNISARLATISERMGVFGRLQRFLVKRISLRTPFEERRYIEQENHDFDMRLLHVKFNGTIYLDGYWQSERYFIDIQDAIREELEIIPPIDKDNLDLADVIRSTNAVCIHVRWFDKPDNVKNTVFSNNVDFEYYFKAIVLIREQTLNPHFFIFSDFPEETRVFFPFLNGNVTYVSHNKGDENAYADLWLMSLCDHFVIANSTFSWWGAWLSKNSQKIVIAPKSIEEGQSAWGFKGLLPDNWQLI